MTSEKLQAWLKQNWVWLAVAAAILIGLVLYSKGKNAGNSYQQQLSAGGITPAQAATLAGQAQQLDASLQQAGITAGVQEAALTTQEDIAKINAQTQQQQYALQAAVLQGNTAATVQNQAANRATASQANTLNFIGLHALPFIERVFMPGTAVAPTPNAAQPGSSTGIADTSGIGVGGNPSPGPLGTGFSAPTTDITAQDIILPSPGLNSQGPPLDSGIGMTYGFGSLA